MCGKIIGGHFCGTRCRRTNGHAEDGDHVTGWTAEDQRLVDASPGHGRLQFTTKKTKKNSKNRLIVRRPTNRLPLWNARIRFRNDFWVYCTNLSDIARNLLMKRNFNLFFHSCNRKTSA